MNTKREALISGDSHWQVPNEVWAHRVPEQFRELLPKRVTLPTGGEGMMDPESGRVTYGGTGHYAGHGPDHFDPTIVHYDKEADVLALYLEKGSAEDIAEVAPGVSVEFGKDGGVIGFEILNASKVFRSFIASHAKRSAAHARA